MAHNDTLPVSSVVSETNFGGDLMAASPSQALAPSDSGEAMGANSTQALALVCFLLAFVVLAGALAGGGIMAWLAGLVLLGVSCVFFRKCRAWETPHNS